MGIRVIETHCFSEASNIELDALLRLDAFALLETARQAIEAIPTTKSDNATVARVEERARMVIHVLRAHVEAGNIGSGAVDRLDKVIDARLVARSAHLWRMDQIRPVKISPEEEDYKIAFFSALNRRGGPPERGDSESNECFWETVADKVVRIAGDKLRTAGDEGPALRTIKNNCQYRAWLKEWRRNKTQHSNPL